MIITLLITFTLSSCDFVNYVNTSTMNQEEIDSLNNKKKECINKLDESFNEANYYEEERKDYIKNIIEAKSLINERLLSFMDKCSLIIFSEVKKFL